MFCIYPCFKYNFTQSVDWSSGDRFIIPSVLSGWPISISEDDVEKSARAASILGGNVVEFLERQSHALLFDWLYHIFNTDIRGANGGYFWVRDPNVSDDFCGKPGMGSGWFSVSGDI